MIKINNLAQLEAIYHEQRIDLNLYEYIKNLLLKSEIVLNQNCIKVFLGAKEVNFKQYEFKWERNKKIGNTFYSEKFYTDGKSGIVLLKKL